MCRIRKSGQDGKWLVENNAENDAGLENAVGAMEKADDHANKAVDVGGRAMWRCSRSLACCETVM